MTFQECFWHSTPRAPIITGKTHSLSCINYTSIMSTYSPEHHPAICSSLPRLPVHSCPPLCPHFQLTPRQGETIHSDRHGGTFRHLVLQDGALCIYVSGKSQGLEHRMGAHPAGLCPKHRPGPCCCLPTGDQQHGRTGITDVSLTAKATQSLCLLDTS